LWQMEGLERKRNNNYGMRNVFLFIC
jgi:hypothetical protein